MKRFPTPGLSELNTLTFIYPAVIYGTEWKVLSAANKFDIIKKVNIQPRVTRMNFAKEQAYQF
jgi:hypothetical protein